MSDNSIDNTDAIVMSYAKQHRFIKLIRNAGSDERNFGSKVHAINRGYEQLSGTTYDYIGMLDADISFDNAYFKALIEKMESDKKLGIAGGIICEKVRGKYKEQIIYQKSVAGAIQFFRSECYEDIGGYIPLPYGGIDACAEIMAREKGWEVNTFRELKVLHHRRVGGKSSLVKIRFKQGVMFYSLGYSPLYFVIRALYKFVKDPLRSRSCATIIGYCYAMYKKIELALPLSSYTFLRNEQMQRLRLKNIRK